MRVLLASITCEKGDLEGNLEGHCEVLAEASRARCELAVLPEFSLTGSVDPIDHPEHAIPLDHDAIHALAAASRMARVAVLFGFGEVHGGEFFNTQAYAADGQVVGVQRKRQLGEDERGFSTGTDTSVFEYGAAPFASMICAEAHADFVWDTVAETGVPLVFLSSAPGLYERRTTEQRWRDGFEWWEERGLGDARRQAKRLGLWVGMATQAGSTVDEDFPGIGALIAPDGEVVERLPDWRPGTLVVDIPVQTDVQPVRWGIRVLVIDESGRALLAEFGDDQSGRRWWVPPGGGIEEGEDDLTCARRELLEEVGRDDLEVGVAIGRRGGSFRLNGNWFTQYERWYLCRCSHFEVADEIIASVRAEGIRDFRWWTTAELRAAAIDTGPRQLPHLIDEILAGRYPDQAADLGR